MTFRTSFALAALSLTACAPEFSFVPKEPDPEDVYAVIDVSPRTIDFGEKNSQETARETVTVTNTGYNTLDVSELTIEVPPSFVVEPVGTTPQSLTPQGTWTFDVVFHPLDAGVQEGTITVLSDAINEPEAPVTVSGKGAIPRLEISPDPMRFGDLFIPCSQQQEFTLRNVGSEPLVISSVLLGGAASMLSLPVPPPADLTLDLNQEYKLPVRFDPTIADRFGAELVVTSNDPAGEAHVGISGSARYAQEVGEQFVVPENLPIDVIVAVDQSCSMDAHAAQLSSQFASFVQVFANANVAWKVGVLTEDSGCLTTLTAATPNWQSQFTSAVAYGGGGMYTEALLKLTQIATNAGCNQGFRDAGAPLHIILVSDEEDQSPNYPAQNYWAPYVTSFRAYAGAGAPMKVHGVVDTTGQTGSSGGPGGYIDAVRWTGGTLLNIYDNNWPSALAAIAQQAVADIGVFELGQRNPDPNSVRVWVDGVEQFSGWTYDPARNAVVFDPDPAPNSVVDVTYGVAVNCGP